MNRELGTTTPVTPTFFSCWFAGSRKSWSQTTSLAFRSAACAVSASAAVVASFIAVGLEKTLASPARPLARSSIALTRFWWMARSGPGGRICCAWSYACCSCCAYCSSAVWSCDCFSAGEISLFENSMPSLRSLTATARTLSM